MYYKLSRGSLSSVDNPPLLLPIKYHIYIYYERCRATGKFDSINVKYVDSLYVYVQCEALAHIFPLQAAGIINSTAKIIHWKSNRMKIAAENCQFRAALVASLCGAIQKFRKFSRDTQEHLSFQIHILIWWHSLWCHFWFELFVIKFSIFSSACFSLSFLCLLPKSIMSFLLWTFHRVYEREKALVARCFRSVPFSHVKESKLSFSLFLLWNIQIFHISVCHTYVCKQHAVVWRNCERSDEREKPN